MAIYLLAGYATPYKYIKECLRAVLEDASAILYDSIVRRLGDFSQGWSEMHLLWLFQYLFKSSYGYKFFQNAIEEIALEFSDELVEDERKAFSLFLLNVTYIKITGNENFDFILNDKVKNIPLCVQLGMRHAGEAFRSKDGRIKKFDRKLRKVLTSGENIMKKGGHRMVGPSRIKMLLDRMYDVPLSKRTDKLALIGA